MCVNIYGNRQLVPRAKLLVEKMSNEKRKLKSLPMNKKQIARKNYELTDEEIEIIKNLKMLL